MLDSEYAEWLAEFNRSGGVATTSATPDPRLTSAAPLPTPKSSSTPWTTNLDGLPIPDPIPEPTTDECEEGLNIGQTKAIQCLLQGMSQIKTSEAVGVSRRSISLWVKLPAFKKVLRHYRKEGLAASMGILQANSTELATTLVTLAKNPLVDPADRIRASV